MTITPPVVLFVDDSPFVRRLFTRLLVMRGYSVSSASEAQEAFALSSKLDLDVVIADLYLGPNQNGKDVLRQVRKKNPNVGKVLIVATDPKAVENSINALGAICLLKPVDIDEVAPCIRKVSP